MPPLLRSTLVAEGNSDAVLCKHLTWLLREQALKSRVEPTTFPDSRTYSTVSKGDLANRMLLAYQAYPCEILFVHRDADSVDSQPRHHEIRQAYISVQDRLPATVAVVPVQETEAWLLFDEAAIRYVADNPTGKEPLNLPANKTIEKLKHPKEKLYEILRTANRRSGMEQRHFRPEDAVRRIPDRITTYQPLRSLKAFRALEAEIRALVQQHGW